MLQEVNTALEHLRREAFIRLVGQPEGRSIDGNRHLLLSSQQRSSVFCSYKQKTNNKDVMNKIG